MLNIVILSKSHLKKLKEYKLALILTIAVVFTSFSQIGIGTATPHQSAILDVSSEDKGFLPPHMSKEQMENDIINPARGLIVYCTDCNPEGIYIYGEVYGEEEEGFSPLQILKKDVEKLGILDRRVITGTTTFDIYPNIRLTPSDATVDYSLVEPLIDGVSITEGTTTVNIAASVADGNYTITVKATGNGNYIGEKEASFKLTISPTGGNFAIPLGGLSMQSPVEITKGITTTYHNLSPTLRPSATVDYSLEGDNVPQGVFIRGGVTLNIPANMSIGEYEIILKATGNVDYTGYAQTTFTLKVTAPEEDSTIINFTDTNFEQAVRSAYNIRTSNVTYGDVKYGTRLNVSDKGITDMREIQYFTALTQLHCYSNPNLTTLDVSQNTALTQLRCYNNNLTTLDLSQNTALTELHCSGNDLTALDVSNSTALIGLNCYSNNLTTLDVSQNTALTTLYCHINALTTLDLSQNTALTQLHCYRNPNLTTLNLSQNTRLTYLQCEGNNLTTLNLSQNTRLTNLYCSNNDFTTLNLSQNTALTILRGQNNPQLLNLDIRGVRSLSTSRSDPLEIPTGNTTNNLVTLKVHENIKNHQNIATAKEERGNNLTISTYSATPGSTNYTLTCADYDPGTGACN